MTVLGWCFACLSMQGDLASFSVKTFAMTISVDQSRRKLNTAIIAHNLPCMVSKPWLSVISSITVIIIIVKPVSRGLNVSLVSLRI